ncbi:XkdQ/YqbQ family protein [Cohnella lupini]|uniref:YqbQ/XkdQ domain-containing protein n=1 Tax=Cohnella lupini TaxID=1294267 RepID=A0A3D9ISD9_9BACL|nr:hypothetical protein [Cohnella lupini]RED64674.1 hypothetical protein DFP95_10294 [Cohnella lupini]
MIELLIDNKNGDIWDISMISSDIEWKTSRIGKASSCEFTVIGGLTKTNGFKCNPGDVVRLVKDGVGLFYGYVFSVDSGIEENVKILAYDQLRYLMTNETYVLNGMTATQIIQKIAGDLQLKVGVLANTKHSIPAMVEDNVKLMDIICKALDRTLVATLQNYVFYDKFGSLTLQNITELALDLVIGDDSLVYSYDFNRSIDSDTFNRIKIVQDNKETGKRDVYIAQDSGNIARWGRLQYFEKADEKMNAAQINEKLIQMMTLKNRESKTLKLDSIGNIQVRAGVLVYVILETLDIKQYFLVDECSHHFNGNDHYMSLNVKVIA